MNDPLSSEVMQLVEPEREIDPQLAEILETYLTGLENGAAPNREQFLDRHPDHAAELAPYLPWIEVLYQAKPREGSAVANPPMPTRLGDFRIVGEIGRGGMGIVYEAEQITLQRRVALKVLPFASMLDERQLTRFKNEALAAAQLHHANIVPVFAVGCDRGLHFYVMQLIEGQTLEQRIRELPPLAESTQRNSTRRLGSAKTDANRGAAVHRFRTYAQWFVQAAEALDHAHNQGIVHRDVKPSNLMISRAGDLWITDFGLARTQQDASMTVSGELLGTLRYMSPEQLRSKPGIVDHRTDIYSLGLTLYELISQRPAFDGQTQQELIRQIENEEPPSLVRRDPQVPRDLDSIVQKAIAKTPEGRYASGRDMADDLRAFLEGRPTLARPATWRDQCDKWIRRHTRLAVSAGLALALVVLCATASAVLVWRAQGETERALVLASDNYRRAEEHLRDARHAVDDVFTGVAADLSEVPGAESVRYQLLNRALAYYRKFAAQATSSPQVSADTAAAYYRCGQVSEQLGDDGAALAAYAQADQVWSTLQAQNVAADHAHSIGLCENNRGLIELRAGRAAEAVTHLRKAMELERALAERNPQDVETRRNLALSYTNLGMALGQVGQAADARDALRLALDLQLAAELPSVVARGELAGTYNQLGYLLSSTSFGEAEAAYRSAAEEFERLAKAEPRVLRWQSQWATTLNNLAALATQAERLDNAETAYRHAVEIQRQLAERAPQVVAYVRDLAVSKNNFGYLLSRQSRPNEAIEQFESARTHLSDLARAHDQSPEYASRLGAVCNNLGLAFESEHRDERARGAFGEAIDWQRKALALSPGWPQAQAYLDTHTANLERINDVDKQADAVGELKGLDARAGKASGTSLEAMRHIAEMTNEASRSAAAQLLPRASSSTARPRSSE